MSIFRTALDTFIGRALVSKPSIEALEELEVSRSVLTENATLLTELSRLDTEGNFFKPSILTNRTAAEQAVAPFAHPYQVTITPANRGLSKTLLVGDARSFLSRDNRPGAPTHVTNVMEFEFLSARIGLGSAWLCALNEGVDATSMRFLSPILEQIYARWLAGNITKRFGLDMGQQMRLQVLACIFYQSLFVPDTANELDDPTINKMAAAMAKAAKAPAEEVVSILTTTGRIKNVEDFCEKVKLVLDNPRLENFNVGVLLTIISGTWFGFGGREIACVAIEHPPTFMAMVYLGLSQRGYKNAPFCAVTEQYKGPKGGDDYVRAVRRLITAK